MRPPARKHACRLAALLMLFAPVPLDAEPVTILTWNIYGYDSPDSSAQAALMRIVDAVDPDVVLFQEATEPAGRSAFTETFAAELPYSFLGAPVYDHPRNQILSAFPMLATGQIFTSDPDGGLFERPTVYADLDVDPHVPGPELRIYSAHHKAGSTGRDETLKLNQATDDIANINGALAANPDLFIVYAGDLNAWVGDPSLNKLTDPGGGLNGLDRLPISDPNNREDMTRWVSGSTIDHIFICDALWPKLIERYILHTETFPSGAVPPPALPTDSHTASDHLALVVVVDVTVARIPDFDEDGDVDPEDALFFHACRTSPGEALSDPACVLADIDRDDDVDQVDFGYFQRCMSGRNIDYDPHCLN